MKLKSLRAVHIDLPPARPKSKPRRAPWPESAPRAMPINFYPQFSRKPQDMPGQRRTLRSMGPSHRRRRHIRTRQMLFWATRRIIHRPRHRTRTRRPKLHGDRANERPRNPRRTPPRTRRNRLYRTLGRRHRSLGPQRKTPPKTRIRTTRRPRKRQDRTIRHRRRPRLVPRTRFHKVQNHQPRSLLSGRRGPPLHRRTRRKITRHRRRTCRNS